MRLILLVACSSLLAIPLLIGCQPDGDDGASSTSQSKTERKVKYWQGPMDPSYISDKPGKSPMGMDLVPVYEDEAPQPASANASGQSGERKVKYWKTPMVPSYISDKPGKSPMGMDLVPVYEDEVAQGSSGLVEIDPTVVQNMGVRMARAVRQDLVRHIRTIGEVEVGEDELSVVNLRFSGWVEKLYADKTGDPVTRGDVLFDIYSPELVASEEEFLLALRAQGADGELTRSARRKLALWDLSDRDIDAIAKRRRARRTMPIRAPRSGFILMKNVLEGARVKAGEDVYHIGDLSRIWVIAEVYEYDAPWVEVGQSAQMELTYERGRVIEGSVAYVYPTLEGMSRTLRVRLEFDNPGYKLKPGMFATVYIGSQTKQNVLAIPTEAIIHSGKREIVFVSRGDGRFESRDVTTGLVGDGRLTEVLSGIAEGEHVVVSGQFLIDSESQLQAAIQKMLDRRREQASDGSDQPAQTEPVAGESMTQEGMSRGGDAK